MTVGPVVATPGLEPAGGKRGKGSLRGSAKRNLNQESFEAAYPRTLALRDKRHKQLNARVTALIMRPQNFHVVPGGAAV